MSSTLPTSPIIDDSSSEPFDLVELLLAEQQSMTAVERFSQVHDAGEEPSQARYYRDLLPATPPSPGTQYAFNVDLDACSGCKACVVACHTMNGLEEEESWRSVGTVTVAEGPESRVQHVTTACHHCEDPGCLNGCPVKAYDKDPATGIVRHLDDQCIGCKYCTMMCPYEVPRYSKRLGIVRKCDMCHQRLSVGEAPACVQSCPNEAISIRIVDSEQTYEVNERLAPGAPTSSITRPSTEYTSRHKHLIRNAIAQDACVDRVAESHWPLAVMLVATQVSVGMLLSERLIATVLWLSGSNMPIEATRVNSLLALLIGIVGLNLASLHLGQPLRAWRVFLGLRTSWLSREAIILGQYVGLLAVAVALLWLPSFADYLPESVVALIPGWASKAALGTALLVGMAGLASSAMIYVATKRQLWRYERTFVRFFGTAANCGLAFSIAGMMYAQAPIGAVAIALLTAVTLTLFKLDWEFQILLADCVRQDSYDHRSSVLVNQNLAQLKLLRVCFAAASVPLLVVAVGIFMAGFQWVAIALVGISAVCMTGGELCERILYFMSVVYDRMPGILR